MLLSRGRAADLAAGDFKKCKGKAPKPPNEDNGQPQDPKHKEVRPSASGEQSRNGKSKQAPPPLAKPPADGAKPPRQTNVPLSGAQPPLLDGALQGETMDPDAMTREQFRQVVARQFLLQAIEANASADERKTFPFKRFVQFAFKHQLTLEGWLVDICPAFPGDPGFKADKIQRFQWRKIWDAVFVNKSLRVCRWTTGSFLLLIYLVRPLLI